MNMLISLRSKDELLNVVNMSLIDLPTPSSLTYLWGFGSLLGMFLMVQVVSGLFLSFHYISDVSMSFGSVIHMIRDVNYGWFLRVVHANGASMFFLLMYIHMGRGIYYGSYRKVKVWMSGVSLFLISMATAFLGYVLPWGQMSFWAATVITNLLSALPYIGVVLVEWIWGGFAVGHSTLVRFFAFHFVLPFVIMFVVMLHFFFLHKLGSYSCMGLSEKYDSLIFHYYYVIKDVYGMGLFFMFFMMICLMYPYVFMDVENFIFSNPLVTPVHIQPEWYFLFAYTILRSVSSSIGGVVALLMSVLILYFLPIFLNHRFRSTFFYKISMVLYWFFVINWLMLTWIGACIVEFPFMILGMYFSVLYFMMFIMMWLLYEGQDMILLWF